MPTLKIAVKLTCGGQCVECLIGYLAHDHMMTYATLAKAVRSASNKETKEMHQSRFCLSQKQKTKHKQQQTSLHSLCLLYYGQC